MEDLQSKNKQELIEIIEQADDNMIEYLLAYIKKTIALNRFTSAD